jgi:hypothetical protein
VLHKNWAATKKLMSVGERKQQIVANIIQGLALKSRLNK